MRVSPFGASVVLVAATGALIGGGPSTLAQAPPARIDFARDVQPLLRQRCVSCHGPTQQMAGLRLDRRRDAMRGSTFGSVIRPANGDASRLFLRVSGTRGSQMPPTGALTPEQIATFKAWIDEGAEWPDELSGDAPRAVPDPAAVTLMTALRAGDGTSFQRALSAAPGSATRQGPDGITPLMYAALYGSVAEMRALLDAGADTNGRNEAGATALFWAVDDAEKTRVLLERGADVNVKSLDGRTPLMVAANRPGASPILRMLLDKGADPNAEFEGLTPLGDAAYAGDVEAIRLLIAKGADPKKGLVLAVVQAAEADCRECLEVLLPYATSDQLPRLAFELLPPNDDGDELPLLLDRGLDVNARNGAGQSILMRAAASDTMSVDVVRRLVAAGADVHAAGKKGETAMGFAAEHGATAVRDAIAGAGAALPPPAALPPLAAPAASPRDAVVRALPLLQQTGAAFRRKAGCVSCHNNTLTARVTAEARRAGITVDDGVAKSEVAGIGQFVESWRERALQGLGIPGDADTVSYILLGLADEGYAPDAGTDAMARFLRNRQLADGSWRTVAHRPPIESNDITVTALSMRAMQRYAPASLRARYDAPARAAGAWLATRKPWTTEERASQLLGLKWAGRPASEVTRAGLALSADQRPDGGWAQLPSLPTDAYATGQALVALHDAGIVRATDPVYQRGVAFLLRTQLADGTWHVASRALPIQPLFDIGFPHGRDSWVSAAGTNWAAIALALAVPRAP